MRSTGAEVPRYATRDQTCQQNEAMVVVVAVMIVVGCRRAQQNAPFMTGEGDGTTEETEEML